MDKKLLNKILPYCGYELKAIYEDDIVDVCISSSGTRMINTERLITKSSDGTYHYKPILFSPECFTKEIETEYGKEVPMIELAKIVYEAFKETKASISEITINDYGYVRIINNYGVSYIFRPLIFSQWFAFESDMKHIPFNPMPVLDYLYSRHIAFNIESDEYVSVESLEKNPYANKI